MNYAFVWKDRDKVVVAKWDQYGPATEMPALIRIADKIGFLDKLTPQDSVWLVSVSSDAAGIRLVKRGVTVRRLPPDQLKSSRPGPSKDKDHLVVATLARTVPGLFYPLTEKDELIVQLLTLVRQRRVVQQEIRIPAQLRLVQLERERLLLRDTDAHELTEKAIKERVLSHPMFAAASEKEMDLGREIEGVLKRFPLYKAVFDPLPYLRGSVVAATIIGEVGDIRWFSTKKRLISYAGLYPLPDGKLPSKVNRTLAQAFWYAAHGAVISGHDNCWKALFKERLVSEKEKHPVEITITKTNRHGKEYPVTLFTPGHLRNRALRWLMQKMLITVYRRWSCFERGEKISHP